MEFAFPVIRRGGAQPAFSTYLAKVSASSRRRVEEILGVAQRTAGEPAEGGLGYQLVCGRQFSIPITFIGSSAEVGGETCVLAHSPGIPGAFPVAFAELERFAHLLRGGAAAAAARTDEATDAEGIAGLCVLEFLRRYYRDTESPERGVALADLHSIGRRRGASLEGMQRLLAVGSHINVEALQLDFPYHCGKPSQAMKQYLDITPEVCGLFGMHMAHGVKLLTPFGVAVCVGVGVDAGLGGAAMMWNPCGSSAGCLAPIMHTSRAIAVGEVRLDYNGPLAASQLATLPESPGRYCYPSVEGKYDVSSWLNRGLFGVEVGAPLSRTCPDDVVLGVLLNDAHGVLELHVRNTRTGVVRCVDDSELPDL